MIILCVLSIYKYISNTFKFKLYFLIYVFAYFYCMNGLIACMSVYHLCAWSLWRSQEGTRSLGTGVTGGCEPLSTGKHPGPL